MSSAPADTLDALAVIFAAVRATGSRTEKRRRLAEYLRALPDASLPLAVAYLGGRPFPRADKRRLSIGGATFSAALLAASPGLTSERLEAAWRRHADPGDAAWDVWTARDPAELHGDTAPMALGEVAALFDALQRARGAAAKRGLLVEAFRRMRAEELRAFVKVLFSETRSGVQESTLEEAVAEATGQSREAVRAVNRLRADLGAVALEARRGALAPPRFAYFTPVDPMLAHPVADTAEAIRRLGSPVWVEDKYDGVRCQLHKVGGEVRLFSRDRQDLTGQFPDVAQAFARLQGRSVLDGELMAVEAGRVLPFPRLQQRLNRLRPQPDVIAAHPVGLVAFDLLAHEDDVLMDAPLRVRRARLETLILPPGSSLAPCAVAESAASLDALFEAARARGNEGLMCKNPDSAYASGRRGYHWLKVKRPLDTLDAIIVGAEWVMASVAACSPTTRSRFGTRRAGSSARSARLTAGSPMPRSAR